jgi:hypothetical protein
MYTYIRINQLWNYNQLRHATGSTALALAPGVMQNKCDPFYFVTSPKVSKASISTALSHVSMNGCFTKISKVNMHSSIKCTLTLESISCGTNINPVM